MKIANSDTLDKLEKLLKNETETSADPFDELPEPIKRLLDQSKEDSAQGKVRQHKDVMADIRAKYNLS